MNGTVLKFKDDEGLVLGEDGNRYKFIIDDWEDEIKIKSKLKINFEIENNFAKDIFVLEEENKNKIIDNNQKQSNKPIDLVNNIMSSKEQNDKFKKIDFKKINEKENDKDLLNKHSKIDRFIGQIALFITLFLSILLIAGRSSGMETFLYSAILLVGYIYSWSKITSNGTGSNAESIYLSMYDRKLKMVTYLPNDLEYTNLGVMSVTSDKKSKALDLIKRKAYEKKADALINLNWTVVKTPIVESGRKGHVSTKIVEEHTCVATAIRIEENLNQNISFTETDLSENDENNKIDNNNVKKNDYVKKMDRRKISGTILIVLFYSGLFAHDHLFNKRGIIFKAFPTDVENLMQYYNYMLIILFFWLLIRFFAAYRRL